jgi:hypothetical protein
MHTLIQQATTCRLCPSNGLVGAELGYILSLPYENPYLCINIMFKTPTSNPPQGMKCGPAVEKLLVSWQPQQLYYRGLDKPCSYTNVVASNYVMLLHVIRLLLLIRES